MNMNAGENFPVVCFLLDKRYDSGERRAAMRAVSRGFRQSGTAFRIEETDGISNLLPGPEATGTDWNNGGSNRKSVLYITDSELFFGELKIRDLPVAVYRHSRNARQNFRGASWILEEPQDIDPDSYLKIWQRLCGLPWTIAETERLRIREMTHSDLDGLYRLYDDPEAKRFLDPLSESREDEKKILKAYIEKVYGLYGYGMWAVCDRFDDELIGKVGFEPYRGGHHPVEMGYLILAGRRGQGIAKEASQAVLDFADRYLDFPAVAIRADIRNEASIKLALSLGFQAAGTDNGTEYFIRRK